MSSEKGVNDQNPDKAGTILILLLALVVPAAITLMQIQHPGELKFDVPLDETTPYGYTWSLLLFIIPNILLVYWLWRHPKAGVERKAFAGACLVIFAAGSLLDLILSYEWFYFPNAGATLGIRLPAFSWSEGFKWIPDHLPIEEFGFYLFGAVFMMALYAWSDVSWFRRYMHPDHAGHAAKFDKLIDFHWQTLLIGITVVAAGILYKVLWGGDGFPGYWCFLVLIGILPPLFLLKAVSPLINWRAFSFMYAVMLMVSLLWEASLGVPYGWWNYRHEQMMGIFIGPWGELPIEAVLMWLIAGWAVVIVYETLRLIGYSGKGKREALFGAKRSESS